jgi:hypothetical protein
MSPALMGIDSASRPYWPARMKRDSCRTWAVNARAEKGGMVAGSGALERLEFDASAGGGGRISRRRAARGADAAMHQDFPRHYHTDLDQFVSRP